MSKDRAEQAFADLNLFGAVVGLLESGAVLTRHGQTTAMKMVGQCKKEMQPQLKAYDKLKEQDAQ